MANDRNVNLINNDNNNENTLINNENNNCNNNNNDTTINITTINNTNTQNIDTQLDLVKILISAHYKNLKNHSDYLKDLRERIAQVDNFEDNQNSDLLAEVAQYLWEQKTPLVNCKQYFVYELIEAFHQNLNQCLKTIKEINDAIQCNNKDKAILFANYLIKVEYVHAQLKQTLHNANETTLKCKIIGSYHDVELYRKLLDLLNPIIPSLYRHQYDNIFLAKISKKPAGKNKAAELYPEAKLDWDFLTNDLKEKVQHNFVYTPEEKNKTYIYEKLIKTFLQEHITYSTQHQDDESGYFQIVEKNIDYFLQLSKLFEFIDKTFCNPITKEFNNEKVITARTEYTKRLVENFLQKWVKTEKELNNYIDSSKKDISTELLTELEASEKLIETLTNEFTNAYKSNWKAVAGLARSTIEVKALYEKFELIYKEYMHELEKVKQQVKELNTESKKLRQKKIEDAKKEREAILKQNKQQRESFQQSLRQMQEMNAQKLNAFRGEQAKIREERQKQIKEERAALINSKPKEAIVEYQNIDVKECIKQLNHQKMSILKSIFAKNETVYYDDVVNLIVNDFGGNVLQIGNGTSHRRIVINKLIIELPEHDSKQEKIEAHSIATGGFFNPHSKKHNPGVLSPCNVKLVRETFEEAGITLAIIKNIEDASEPSNEQSVLKV